MGLTRRSRVVNESISQLAESRKSKIVNRKS
jgi:hypothetical protein